MICLGLRYILIADVFSLLLSNANCLDSRIDSAVLRVRLLAFTSSFCPHGLSSPPLAWSADRSQEGWCRELPWFHGEEGSIL